MHLLLCAIALPARAQQDWLAALPPCSTEPAEAGVPRFELVYPRPGLPALVEAGARLVARVRLPAPLTPPPGVQQPRALAGFGAELVGHALPLSADGRSALVHGYPLEVVDVRPDGASSLLYRVAIAIPAFVAPGSYDLALVAPGGSARVISAVRVYPRGETPRLALIADVSALQGVAGAALPVDVWLQIGEAPNAAQAQAMPAGAAPLLDLRGLVLALRVGRGVWVLGECGGPTDVYAAEVASVLARERRERLAPPSPVLVAGWYQPLGAAARALPRPGALALGLRGDAVTVDVANDYGGPAELAFRIGPNQQAQVSNARASFFPAGEIARAAPARIVRLRVASGTQAVLSAAAVGTAATPSYALRSEPHPARSGDRLRLQVRGADGASLDAEGARVAFRFGPLHSAFGPATAEHRFLELGEHRVQALVLAADGHAERVEGTVTVQTTRAFGCAIGAPAGGASQLPALWPALLLLQRRRLGQGAAAKKHARCSARE